MQRFGPGERLRQGWQVAERRRQPRMEVPLPVQVCGEVSGLLLDISRHGLCLLTAQRLAEREVVSFHLVDAVTGLSCPFRARVVWYLLGMPGRAGLEFLDMEPSQDAWLASRFVEWLAADLEN